MPAAAVVIFDSEGDRQEFNDVIPSSLSNKATFVRKLAGARESEPWWWEGHPSNPTFSAPPSNFEQIGVAIQLTSKSELDAIIGLASTRNSILCGAPLAFPSDVFEADWKYVWDQLR